MDDHAIILVCSTLTRDFFEQIVGVLGVVAFAGFNRSLPDDSTTEFCSENGGILYLLLQLQTIDFFGLALKDKVDHTPGVSVCASLATANVAKKLSSHRRCEC